MNTHEKFYRKFGNAIRQERIRREITVTQMADEVGVSRYMMHSYEGGRVIPLARALDIAKVLLPGVLPLDGLTKIMMDANMDYAGGHNGSQ